MDQDYFALFGLETKFEIDLKKLRQTYLALQKKFHPDRYATHSPQERLIAVQMTANINQAYHTLGDGLLRGEYILKILNPELDKSETINDMEFLSLQMQLRDDLAQVNNSYQQQTLLESINHQTEDLIEEFAKNYQNKAELAQSILQKINFFFKLKQEALKINF